jgi:membrane carboxypeptidase/penicillin-binding protein PbpC
VKPEDGAEFVLVPGSLDQRVVCQAGDVAPDERLWWFADGAPAGETVGRAPFTLEMKPGRHVVTCATESGESATASFTVKSE